MAGLSGHRRADLIELANVLGVAIETNDIVKIIIKKIVEDPDYDRELTLGQIKIIVEDRKEAELRENCAAERRHELEKLRLTREADTASISSDRTELPRKPSLKSIMQKFDPQKSEITLFLNLFERQAKKANIEEDELVTQLLALIPVELAEFILREDAEKTEDYDYVKEKLLERYRLSPEALRSKFVTHQKRPDSMWKDLIFELRSYLDGWLAGLKITSVEQLKNLMIVDQIKRLTPPEIKDRLLDSWAKYTDPEELTKKLDEYEAVSKSLKKSTNPNPRHRSGSDESFEKNSANDKKSLERKTKTEIPNWRERKMDNGREDDRTFERRKPLLCYQCNSDKHLRYNCPELRELNTERVNRVSVRNEMGESFEPYLSTAWLDDKRITVLRDSGSSLDVVPKRMIKPSQLSGEKVFVRQALDNGFRCLPLAHVELNIPNVGKVKTKAIVLSEKVKMSHYLLGNKTQKLIDTRTRTENTLKAVKTHNLTKSSIGNLSRTDNYGFKTQETKGEIEERSESIVTTIKDSEISPVNNGGKRLSSVSPKAFADKNETSLLLEGSEKKTEVGGNLEVEIAVRQEVPSFEKNRRGSIRKQLVGRSCDRENNKECLGIPGQAANPDNFDINEIMSASDLANKCDPGRVEELRSLFNKHKHAFSNDPKGMNLTVSDIEITENESTGWKPYRSRPRQRKNLRDKRAGPKIYQTHSRQTKGLNFGEEKGLHSRDNKKGGSVNRPPKRDTHLRADYRKGDEITFTEFPTLPESKEKVKSIADAKFVTFLKFRKFKSNLLKGYKSFCVSDRESAKVFSDNWETHLQHLDIVLKKITEAKLKIESFKSEFADACGEDLKG